MEHTKGKLRADIKSGCIISDKGFMICDVGFVNTDPVANTKELVRRWNAFEEGGLVDELRIACEESQKAIMLLYECNKDVEIALGSGFQLKKAEKLLEAALAKS